MPYNTDFYDILFARNGGGGADVSGVTATAADVDTGKVFVDSSGAEISTYKADYTALNTLVGQTTATAEDVDTGKVFVNSSGQGVTGTSTTKASIINMIERPQNAIVTIPNGVTKIGDYIFYRNDTLTSLYIPSSITSIGQYAFYGCSNLSSLTNLPSGITDIGRYAFNNCYGLTTLTFEGTPTSIATSAFTGCMNLITIRVPWASGAVAGAPWGATNATITYNYTP